MKQKGSLLLDQFDVTILEYHCSRTSDSEVSTHDWQLQVISFTDEGFGFQYLICGSDVSQATDNTNLASLENPGHIQTPS